MKSGVSAMKYLKSISLFLVYPLLTLGIGFYAGVKCSYFFYPETPPEESVSSPIEAYLKENLQEDQNLEAAQETAVQGESNPEDAAVVAAEDTESSPVSDRR